jgi:putative hydrolase of the HAD superfamily
MRPRGTLIAMPLPNAILAITLDLDDTLWPVRPALVHAETVLAQWLAERAPRTALRLTPENRREIRAQLLAEHPQRAHDMSFLRREALRRALVAAGDDGDLAEPAFDAFLAARQQVTLYQDVVPVLSRWAQRYRLVAVSNGNADIARIGLGEYFTASVSAHEVGFGKPDPRIFLEACRRAGADPGQVLHVGDDLDLDVRAAQGAGLQAAWIRRADLARAQDPAAGASLQGFDSLQALDVHLHPPPAR